MFYPKNVSRTFNSSTVQKQNLYEFENKQFDYICVFEGGVTYLSVGLSRFKFLGNVRNELTKVEWFENPVILVLDCFDFCLIWCRRIFKQYEHRAVFHKML